MQIHVMFSLQFHVQKRNGMEDIFFSVFFLILILFDIHTDKTNRLRMYFSKDAVDDKTASSSSIQFIKGAKNEMRLSTFAKYIYI